MNAKSWILLIVAMLPLFAIAAMFVGCAQNMDTTESEISETERPSGTPESSAQAQIDALAQSYLAIRESLAQDQFGNVPDRLRDLHDAAQRLSESDNPAIREPAQIIAERAKAKPENIEDSRETFGAISAAAIDLFQEAAPSDQVAASLYVAYCPMAEASWLQKSEELANPYMGQKMLQCGEIRETIKSDAA